MVIDSTDQRFLVPLLVHNDLQNITLDLELPNKKLIELWSKTIATLPINGMVYGSYIYHKSYRVFLKNISNNNLYESKYFDDDTGHPSKNSYSTSTLNNKPGFSRFIFHDIAAGTYVLYIVAGSDIIHSRLIDVEPRTITVIY